MLKKICYLSCFSLLMSAQISYAQNLTDPKLSYDECLDQANGNTIQIVSCTVQEANRVSQAVEQKYQKLANMEITKQWNQGVGMYSGNFKDLFAKWTQYRDKYCSLYGYSTSPEVDQGTINQLNGAECVLELSKRQNKDMDVIIQNLKDFQ